jgi:hypothetical protein
MGLGGREASWERFARYVAATLTLPLQRQLLLIAWHNKGQGMGFAFLWHTKRLLSYPLNPFLPTQLEQ